MVNTELFEALALLEKEKGIPHAYMLEQVEAALLSAVKRFYGTSDNAKIVMNEEKADIKILIAKEVVGEVEDPATQIDEEGAKKYAKRAAIGDVVNIEVKTKDFGRIAAQTAKQVIIQGIREAEKGLVYQQFASREKEILTALVTRVDERTGIVSLEIGKTDAILLPSEQIPGEHLREGQRIRVYVVEAKKTAKGPQVVISRTHPGLVKRLFELEVPEIHDGIIEIRSISREAGSRSKIAVYSSESNIDPIGACIGPRGSRVSNIVNELQGEKIDIVRYSDDPGEYVSAALSPSDVISVEVNEEENSCRVVVPDDQLSLAIGKEGQNARLAAKLTGWKIDIRPESQA